MALTREAAKQALQQASRSSLRDLHAVIEALLNGDFLYINGQQVTATAAQLNALSSGGQLIYAHNASDQTRSMSYSAMSQGDVFRVNYFGVSLQEGSSGIWRCFATTGMGTLGSISYVAGTGIVLECVNGRCVFVPGAANIVDIRAVGIICDGVTVGQQTRFTSICAAAVAHGYMLVNGKGSKVGDTDRMQITETVDLRRISCDLRFSAGTRVTTTTAPASGDFYTGGNGGSQSGITTYDWPLADASLHRVGIAVRAGGDGSNSLRCLQFIDVKGDGNFDHTTTPTCMGVRFENDNSPIAVYNCETTYCYLGGVIHDSMEKNSVFIRATYCNWAASVTGATADTLHVVVHASNCQHWVWELDGSDTSVHWECYTEARDDPGDGTPAFWFRDGKFSRLSGQGRSANGDIDILIDKSGSFGVDTFLFDNYMKVHGYGAVIVRRCRHLMGHLYMKDIDDAPDAGGARPCPALWIQRVIDAGSFTCHMSNIKNREGLRIGQASAPTFTANTTNASAVLAAVSSFADIAVNRPITGTGIPANAVVASFDIAAATITMSANSTATNTGTTLTPAGFYAIDASLGNYSIEMGLLTPFNTNGTENASGFPTTLTAMVVEKTKGGTIRLLQSVGNIDISGCLDDTRIIVPASMDRYTITKGAGVCTVGYETLATAGLTIT